MNNIRDVLALSLALSFTQIISLLFSEFSSIIHFIMPYLCGCLIFLTARKPTKIWLYFIIIETILVIPIMVKTYPVMRDTFGLFGKSLGISFPFDRWYVFAVLSYPIMSYAEMLGSEKTIEKLKLRERIGF